MAGAGTNYFNSKIAQYEPVIAAAQQATNKVAAAKQALQLLQKPSISQVEAESLVALYQQVE